MLPNTRIMTKPHTLIERWHLIQYILFSNNFIGVIVSVMYRGGGGGGGGGANGENGELLTGFSIFSIEKVSILCHFMPFYAILCHWPPPGPPYIPSNQGSENIPVYIASAPGFETWNSSCVILEIA